MINKNLPNRITLARIALVFIVLCLANLYDKFKLPGGDLAATGHAIQYAAVLLAIIAALTDLLDGYLARKYHWISDFGKLMDPLADKIFVMTIFLVYVDKVIVDKACPANTASMLPGWVVVVVLSREFLVTGLRTLAAAKGEVISADKFGKAKTATQMTFFAIGAFFWLEWFPLTGAFKIVWIISMWLVAGVTVMSGLTYYVKHRHLYLSET